MKKNSGVTLVELTVSMSIFAIVISLAVSLFVLVLRIQNQATAIRAVQQNTRFAFESFFRETRLAQGFYNSEDRSVFCNELPNGFYDETTRNLLIPGKKLVMKNFKGDMITYTVETVGGRKFFQSKTLIKPCPSDSAPGATVPEVLTGDEVNITKLTITRDQKYKSCDDGGVSGRPPLLITLDMGLETFNNVDSPYFDQSFDAKQTVSLRGEFRHFFPEISCTL